MMDAVPALSYSCATLRPSFHEAGITYWVMSEFAWAEEPVVVPVHVIIESRHHLCPLRIAAPLQVDARPPHLLDEVLETVYGAVDELHDGTARRLIRPQEVTGLLAVQHRLAGLSLQDQPSGVSLRGLRLRIRFDPHLRRRRPGLSQNLVKL